MANPNHPRQMAADFPLYATKETVTDLCKRFQTSRKTIARWRKQLGITQAVREHLVIQPPKNFRELTAAHTHEDLAKRLGVSTTTIRRWRRDMGIQRVVRPGSVNQRSQRLEGSTWSPAVDRVPAHDGSVAGMAANFLRRLAPTYRCNETGGYSITGKFWRHGRLVLSDAEIIARAERKGWRADAWRMVGGDHQRSRATDWWVDHG